MPYLTGGQAVIETLSAFGVDTIFGIPGVHTLPVYDAMLDTPGLRHILARHEQGAGFMADGYARISGKVGVVSVITGPGVTNVCLCGCRSLARHRFQSAALFERTPAWGIARSKKPVRGDGIYRGLDPCS